jgi:ribosomal protein S18 acetylase RimI-like enzyme
MIESHPLGLFIVIPYIMFSEAYFFRRKRYFTILKQQIVGTLALQEKADTLNIINLAASPFYRKIGVATYMLDFSATVAKRLHKNSLELSVLKANTPALKLYVKSGFRKKKEKRRSFILTKSLHN